MSAVVTYRMPQMGLGTDFSEFDRPINFATTYTNRFRNITGGAERRPGMSYFNSYTPIATTPNLTRLHEFVDQTGRETLLASDDFGNIWRNDPIDTGPISEVSIAANGSGYIDGLYENAPVSGGSGSGATADVVIANGQLASININQPGNGYNINDVVTAVVDFNINAPVWTSGSYLVAPTILGNANGLQTGALQPIIIEGTANNPEVIAICGVTTTDSTNFGFQVTYIDVTGDAPVITNTYTASTIPLVSTVGMISGVDPTGRYIAMSIQDSFGVYFIIFDTQTTSFGASITGTVSVGNGSVCIAWLDATHFITQGNTGSRTGIDVYQVAGTTITALGFTDVFGSDASRLPIAGTSFIPLTANSVLYIGTNNVAGNFDTLYAASLQWNGSSVTVGSPYTLSLATHSGSYTHATFLQTATNEYTIFFGGTLGYGLISINPGASSSTIVRPWQTINSSSTLASSFPLYIEESNKFVIMSQNISSGMLLTYLTLNTNSFSLLTQDIPITNSPSTGAQQSIAILANDAIISMVSTGFNTTVSLGFANLHGSAFRFEVTSLQFESQWTLVLSGKGHFRLISAEANNKLIFVNGVDRNFYTNDAGNSFQELLALITTGTLAGGSDPMTVIDGNVSDWINATLVSNNDIVHNVTRNGYGVVTAVASASLTITPIGVSATGAGNASSDQQAGDAYQLIDYVNMSIIPNGAGGSTNVGTATTGTTTSIVAVSGVNFSTTEIREDDFIYNSTQGAIAHVGSVSANVNLKEPITGQSSGDALVFFKSAMPISSWIHVHYGRVAYLDARNNQRIVFSAPDDPQDVTTFQKTLDSTSFQFGTQQPEADTLVSMDTFLSYFVASGKKNLFIYQGDTPIQDTASTTINFTPIAFYPNGVAGRFGLETNGGDLLHITVDGLQAINIGYNAFSVNQNNASVPILNTLRQAINSVLPNTDNIQLTYYPRRRWLVNKIGDQCYILNTQASYDQTGTQQQIASWHLFSGIWAQQNHYFVRRNGDLISCGSNGGVYLMDASASTDVGTRISTNLTTSWLRLEEPQITPRIKEFHFIRPVFESSPDVEYTISGVAGLDNYSSDSITVSAGGTGAIGVGIVGITPIGGGSFAQTTKYPLRLRGEQARYQFVTESSASEDTITSFSLFGNVGGYR